MNTQTATEELLTWNFPLGITFFVIAAVILTSLFTLSYLYTLRAVPFRRKVLPLLLRILSLAVILLCLADPRRTTIRKTEFMPDLKLAMIFDESGSMQRKSVWGKSRLEEAVEAWQKKIRHDNAKIEYFAFGKFLRRINSPEDLLKLEKPLNAKENEQQTNLGYAFRHGSSRLAAAKFHGVVWFTDGLDTAGSERDQLPAMIGGSGLDHVFVPLTQSLPSDAELTFRKVEVPSNVQIGTDAQALFLVRSGNLSAKDEGTFELIRNDYEVLTTQKLPEGTGLRTIRCDLKADAAGRDRLTARLLLNGDIREQVTLSVDKIKSGELANVLIYNGAPEFGTRFIRNVFRDNPEVAFDIRYAEGVFPGARNKGSAFPTAEELTKYDVVVLMNLRKNNLRAGAAKDIDTFVQNGGGLLFLCGNPLTAREFASSELEKLLPVTFENTGADNRSNAEAASITNQIEARGPNVTGALDDQLVRNREFTFRPPQLFRYCLTEVGRRSPLFQNHGKNNRGELLQPEYQDSCTVRSVKQGTNVLATRPDGRALVASQNYGAGRSMVIASDPLWRWKMNLASDNTAYEVFWKNVFSYLSSRKNPCTGFTVADASPGRKAWKITLDSRTEDVTTLICDLKRGDEITPVAMHREGDRTVCTLEPQAKTGVLKARNTKGEEVASLTFAAQTQSKLSPEMRILEPDLELLHELSALSNVTICEPGMEWDPVQRFGMEKTSIEERAEVPLWHGWIVLGVLLGLLCLEWLIRRKIDLL